MAVSFKIGYGLNSSIIAEHVSALGQSIGSRVKLLNWLESQLGLQVPNSSLTDRALKYLACLKEKDSSERFYNGSLAVDPLGSAKEILRWRDQWYLDGWSGAQIVGGSKRQMDIAEVEVAASALLSLNEGQRVRRVLGQLDKLNTQPVVTSIDPIEIYPNLWRQLLKTLKADVEPGVSSHQGNQQSDLGRIQGALLQASEGEMPDGKVELSGDGSVAVIDATSRELSASWLSHFCRTNVPSSADYKVGIVASGSIDTLDSEFYEAGIPRTGLTERSPLRPVLQVLPLSMELLWEPLNPYRVLEFLAHPAGPIPRRIRMKLAEVVAAQPGIGGTVWKQAIKQIEEKEISLGKDEDQSRKQWEKYREAITFWLEGDRYQENSGAPIAVIKERIRRLSDWLSGLRASAETKDENDPEVSLYFTAQGQLRELNEALDQLAVQGSKSIGSNDLRRLIKSVRGEGAARPDVVSEISPEFPKLMCTQDSAGCVSAVDTLLWWGVDSPNLLRTQKWSVTERQAFDASDIKIQDSAQLLEWQASTWLRPLLRAKRQLLLIRHSNQEGAHPIFDLLNACVSNLPKIDLLDALQGKECLDHIRSPGICAYDLAHIPVKQRLWQLPDSTLIKKRETESFSSLESFIYGPYMWVLNYAARIRSGSILTVNDDNLLKGSVAHQLFEDFFNAFTDIQNLQLEQTKSWASAHIDKLIKEVGMVLMMPGRAAERERFIDQVVSALVTLVRYLHEGNVVSVVMESRSEGKFIGGKLAGYLDLTALHQDGSESVIDLKWGGEKYRKESLKNDQYLQLAIYAVLRRQETKKLPNVGYFIISTEKLLMLDSSPFKSADHVKPDSGESVLEFWQRFETSWKERRAQLDKGMIEVNVSGTESLIELAMPENGLAGRDTFESFSEYGALVGWEAGA